MSKDDFVLRLVTIDETWVHDRQFVGPGSPRPKSQDTTICRQGDGHSILGRKKRYYIRLLPNRSTITEVYYANLLDQLRTAIREKRRGKLFKGILLQQDIARVHTCRAAMNAVERNGYKLISYSCLFA